MRRGKSLPSRPKQLSSAWGRDPMLWVNASLARISYSLPALRARCGAISRFLTRLATTCPEAQDEEPISGIEANRPPTWHGITKASAGKSTSESQLCDRVDNRFRRICYENQ